MTLNAFEIFFFYVEMKTALENNSSIGKFILGCIVYFSMELTKLQTRPRLRHFSFFSLNCNHSHAFKINVCCKHGVTCTKHYSFSGGISSEFGRLINSHSGNTVKVSIRYLSYAKST